MGADRTDGAIIALVMAAVGLILLAPLLGRIGAPGWADIVMLLAAGAGVCAFVLAAVYTFCAARGRVQGGKGGET